MSAAVVPCEIDPELAAIVYSARNAGVEVSCSQAERWSYIARRAFGEFVAANYWTLMSLSPGTPLSRLPILLCEAALRCEARGGVGKLRIGNSAPENGVCTGCAHGCNRREIADARQAEE